ncbi:hypothetical protein BH23ACT3_BH23ACT3_23410 [soil metagenome]
MRGRYRKALALTGALGLIAAGCGGDDGASESADPADPADPVGADSDDHDDDDHDDGADDDRADDDRADDDGDRPLVVATTTIWADVTSNVVCHSLAEVASVVPAGADAHFYEPSLQDRRLMGDADIVIANGLFLEEALIGTIEAAAAEGVALFEVAENIADPIEFDGDDDHGDDDHDDHGDDHGDDDHDDHGDDDHGDDDHGDDDHDDHGDDDHGDDHGHDDHGDDHGDDDHGDHGHDGDDPHVWFDPARVAAVLPMLGDAIVDATGIDADAVAECVADYQDELMETDAAMSETFSVIDPDMRLLVSTHESLGYLADRYGFEIIGTVLEGTSSMAETNPADLEDLAREISATGVPAVFAEAESNQADIEALASRADVEVVILPTESLGEPGSGFDTYVGFLLGNAQLIADALG